MDRSKWILAMGIVAMMLAVGVFIPADTVVEGDTPTADPNWYSLDKTSFDIYDVEDLLAFAEAVNGKEGVDADNFSEKTVDLRASLDISEITSWTPIGKGTRSSGTASGTPFKGTFNGNDYVISGLTITSANATDAIGLFGIIDGGTVENLIMEKVTISVSGNGNAGAIAGLLCGGGTISRCVSGSPSETPSDNYKIDVGDGGGIVGRVLKHGTLSYCQNFTEVSGPGKCGGIVAAAYYTDSNAKNTMKIENCTNFADITSTGGYTGGIAGLSAAFTSNCVNTGNVQGCGDAVGGIIGDQKQFGAVEYCENYGSISITGGNGRGIGGIVGWVRYDGNTTDYPTQGMIRVDYCVNYGNVDASTGTAGDAGGIIGMVHQLGSVFGNVNVANSIKGKTFAAGITTYQLQEYTGRTVEQKLIIQNNASKTTVDSGGINASSKSTVVYLNNSTNVTSSGNIEGGTPDGFVYKTQPAKLIISRDKTPVVSITASIAAPIVGDTVKLTATVSNQINGPIYGFLWSTYSDARVVDVTSGGEYRVTVTVTDGIRTFSGTASLTVTFKDKIETTTDESTGTTTTVTEKADGSKVTVIENSSNDSKTTVTENTDGSKVTEVEDSEGVSVTKETTAVIEETETTTTTISSTTVVVKDTGSKVTSAEAKAEVKVETKESAQGTSTVELSQEVVQAALTTLTIEDETEDVQVTKTLAVVSDTTQISLTAEATKAVSESSASLEFVGSAGTLTADTKVVETLAAQGDSLTISFVKTDDVVLPDTQQTVEDPTAYRLTVTKSDGSTVHELNGNVDLTVEYEPPTSVTASEVVVIYVDDDGTMEAMTTTYDPDTKILKFSTDHFSYFMVGTKSMLEPTEPDVKPPIFIVIPDSGDDSVPIVIVDQNNASESDDGSAKTVACAVAAVVVVIMLLFLARDIRTK